MASLQMPKLVTINPKEALATMQLSVAPLNKVEHQNCYAMSKNKISLGHHTRSWQIHSIEHFDGEVNVALLQPILMFRVQTPKREVLWMIGHLDLAGKDP